jgi:hypothetical protein
MAHAVKNDAPLRTSASVWKSATVPDQGFALIRAVTFEFRRAIAAERRYEQLRLKPRASDDPDALPARRVYLEFYSDR